MRYNGEYGEGRLDKDERFTTTVKRHSKFIVQDNLNTHVAPSFPNLSFLPLDVLKRYSFPTYCKRTHGDWEKRKLEAGLISYNTVSSE